MAQEPDERKVSSDACITLSGVRYQLTPEMAGEKVIILLSQIWEKNPALAVRRFNI